MRGFPVIFVLFVVGSIVVRLLKAIAEAQQQRNNEEAPGDQDDQWNEWTPPAASPPPPPVAKVAPPPLPPSSHPRSMPSQPPVAPVARTTVRELLRELQQANAQPVAPARPVARRAARPAPPPVAAGDESPAYVRLSDAFASDDQVKPAPHPTPKVEPSLALAFPEADGTPSASPTQRRSGFRLQGRDDLRRAFIAREILDRPRAFDL